MTTVTHRGAAGGGVCYLRLLVLQSVIDEEAKGDSAKHVFISGQTTHITIEEEHPGGEELNNSDSQIDDDDFDVDVQPLPAAKHGDITRYLVIFLVEKCKVWRQCI